MVERARQEHGTLTINSQPGEGTVLVLSLPIGESDHE
jgi:signal transduction histidine kinase